MRVLVTGGAGFIGRWVLQRLLANGDEVWGLDNLSNGSEDNLAGFASTLREFVRGDVRNMELLAELFQNDFAACIHLAAKINVQDSIEHPRETFEVNTVGTLNLLQEAKATNTKVVFVSSALVYATANGPIGEDHSVKPASPYAASKIAAENLVLAYYHTYGLPTVVLRPFSAYGPYQRADAEGGVMSIFLRRNLLGEPLEVFGDGCQTRDFFYVEDCADFIVQATRLAQANGQILNAGSGQEMRIRDLALRIAGPPGRVRYIPHHHPQSEVYRMVSNYSKAKRLLGWTPQVSLEEGIRRTRAWVEMQASR